MKFDEPEEYILTLNFNSNDIPSSSEAHSINIPWHWLICGWVLFMGFVLIMSFVLSLLTEIEFCFALTSCKIFSYICLVNLSLIWEE
jgi:hypothetical protein